jgi:hypothetical protein
MTATLSKVTHEKILLLEKESIKFDGTREMLMAMGIQTFDPLNLNQRY